jgi:hypothetical protein
MFAILAVGSFATFGIADACIAGARRQMGATGSALDRTQQRKGP